MFTEDKKNKYSSFLKVSVETDILLISVSTFRLINLHN